MIALHPPSMTTSLALLPAPAPLPHSSSPAASSSSAPAVRAPSPQPASSSTAPAAQRRPKLSLNTATTQFRTLGKGSSLRLETLSAVSPTARNTFSNGYEPAPVSADASVCKPWTARVVSDQDTPSSASTFNSSTSASSFSSLGSDSAKLPYKQPHNVQSILSNSPLPPAHRHRSAMSASRPMFPATKRVSFRAPLTEEITTTKYTLAHSDIASSSSTLSSLALDTANSTEEIESDPSPTDTTTAATTTTIPTATAITIPTATTATTATTAITTMLPSRTAVQLNCQLSKPTESASAQHHSTERPRSQKRDSPSDSESDSDSCPETPVAGRRKRRREWVWTLGPINGQKPDSKYLREEDSDMSDPENDRMSCQERFEQFAERRPSDASDEGSIASPTSSTDGDRR